MKFINNGGGEWNFNNIPSSLMPSEIIVKFLADINAVSSKGEAKRLIKQGAVKIYFETENKNIGESKVDAETYPIPRSINEFTIKVGKKKIYKIKSRS